MPRPKPVSVLKAEKKSHRTKAELEAREKAEAELLSGMPLTEREKVKQDGIAHAEFLRVYEILDKIGKADSLYTGTINRYCEIYSEIRKHQDDRAKLETMRDGLSALIDSLKEKDDVDVKDLEGAIKAWANYLRQINQIDLMIQQKRKMLGDIEKENCMTVAAALRSIPKTAENKDDDVLLKILNG